MEKEAPITNVKVRLVSKDSGLCSIIAQVSSVMMARGHGVLAQQFAREAINRYDDPLRVCRKYVHVEWQ